MPKSIASCRVLELGGYVAAPFASLVLANLGAEIIKVEALRGDPTRARKSNFIAMNAGKRSVAIDLKDERTRAMWNDLVASSDVIVSNLDAQATRNLAVDYESTHGVNPAIVYCQVKAFGPGPYGDLPATNPIVEALAGVMSITWAEGRPARQASPFYDQLAGVFAALGIVQALGDDGADRYFEVDLFETGLFSGAGRIVDYFVHGELAGEVWGTAPYDTFQTSDGKWLFLGVVNDRFWEKFCDTMGLTAEGADPRFRTSAQRLAAKAEVEAIAARALGELTRTDAIARLEAAGIPCAPVNDYADLAADTHVSSPGKLVRGTFEGSEFAVPAFPMRAPFVTAPTSASPPSLGADTEAVLGGLGYGDEIDALSDARLIGRPPQG